MKRKTCCVHLEDEDYYDDDVLLSLVDMSVRITLLTIINNEIFCVLMDH